jgi:hypothetical protein
MWWILLLIATLTPIAILFLLALLSTLGLEADQEHVKSFYRWLGTITSAYGCGAENWFVVICGAIFLLISHPKLNLPLISKRIDQHLENVTNSSTV